MEPSFFATPAEFRAWLEANHATARELLVGFDKRGSGRPSITWSEAVDEGLCFGWIDGVRRRIDDATRMHAAELAAFAARADERSAIYAYEQRDGATLDDEQLREFRANDAAWTFFESQPPSYRKAAIWWVVSAKKDETKKKRLATLVDDSAHGRRVAPLTPRRGA